MGQCTGADRLVFIGSFLNPEQGAVRGSRLTPLEGVLDLATGYEDVIVVALGDDNCIDWISQNIGMFFSPNGPLKLF